MNIYITTTCNIKGKDFLKGDFLEDVTLVNYHDGCSECVEAHTDEFYLYILDGTSYYIPEYYGIQDDDGDIVIDGTHPIERFIDVTSIPWPGKAPIKDYETAYEEMLNIKLTDDPYVRSYKQSKIPNDPGKNTAK